MALIKCPECGKEISDKSEICIGCGFPIKSLGNRLNSYFETQDNLEEKLENEDEFLDRIYKSENGKTVKMIKAIREEKGYDLETSKRMVDEYCQKKSPSRMFNGIYKYTFLGGKQEVYCPRCGSDNCSHYQEQKIIPGKTKTRYTANLNPLKPFTFANKKEKVVRKEQMVTERKIICNDCGMIFR